jgi:hypothetical protein
MDTTPLPSAFHPELTNARLATVSQMLLEELYATDTDLVRDTDSGYTRGCTTFGRQRSRLVAEALSGKYPWLELRTGANDVVFTIAGIPCRFSNDDPGNPSKDAVLTASRFQMDFLEFAGQGEPGRFCFVIDRGYSEDQEPRVVFLGFTPGGSIACRWESDTVRMLRLADKTVPPKAVDVAKPSVAPKKKKKDSGDAAAASEVLR